MTLYGVVDLNGRYVKNDGSARRYSLSQDGLNSSRLGFRGIEDLGGGLRAGFVLEGGVNADTGSTNAKFFNRRSTVSLLGNFGEVRLGRDYTPTFWNNTIFDAFGTNGVGDSTHVAQLLSGTFVRADNSIGYFLPQNIGGIYGQFMVAAAEGATAVPGAPGATCTVTNPPPAHVPAATCSVSVAAAGTGNPGRYIGGRLGFAAGPFDIAGSYGQQRFVSGASQQKTYNIGGSFDFGVVKLMGYFDRDTTSTLRENRGNIGVVVPLGQGEIHASYSRGKLRNTPLNFSNSVNQIAAGYVYNLSKRTAVYTNVARVDNDSRSALGVAGGTSITAAPTLGGKSTGAEFGLRHIF